MVIKAVPHPTNACGAYADDVFAEIGAMQLLHYHSSEPPLSLSDAHPSHHTVKLLDCFQDSDYIYMVLPYMSGGDLYYKIKAAEGNGLPQDQVASYLRQVVHG